MRLWRAGLDGFADLERENALLLAIVEATSSGPDVGPLSAAVAGLIVEATATDVCFVHLLDDEGSALTLAGATPPFDSEVGLVRLPIGTGVTGWVAEHGQPVVIVDDKQADDRYVPIPALRGTDYTSMASVPMTSHGAGLVGVLNVHTVARREFTAHDIRLLTTIGRLVAGALHSARLHRRLVARERAHEQFTEQVIAAQETERRRLAGDIHDGISQRLVSLGYHLDAAARTLHNDPAYAAQQLALARELADITVDEARIAIGGLRPPVLDDLGLAGGLASLCRTVPDLHCELDLGEDRLPEHVEIALYRIAQEALQNVQKHARATSVHVRFATRAGSARLDITDDGGGFDLASAGELPVGDRIGYGIRSMAERAELVGGTFTVRSKMGSGTRISVSVPTG
ncbi:GAF domain-containing sensor histidine kinase [Pseudonocardia aurantiaca]|uniref:GAF domain-containing sensor histidine kinase n=1 Tax=Pseudonocardia aurantiaca TaxID=75290 RepID=A0ABW4FHD1_9PSEU